MNPANMMVSYHNPSLFPLDGIICKADMESGMRSMRFGKAEQRNQYAVPGNLGILDFTRMKLAGRWKVS